MKNILYGLVFIFILLPSAFAAQTAADYELLAFTTKNYAITPSSNNQQIKLSVYYLDAPSGIEKDFAQNFQGLNETDSFAKAKSMQNSKEMQEFTQQMFSAYDGLIKAFKIGIHKVPAIVFVKSNKNAKQDVQIIYGLTNIDKAIQIYNSNNL